MNTYFECWNRFYVNWCSGAVTSLLCEVFRDFRWCLIIAVNRERNWCGFHSFVLSDLFDFFNYFCTFAWFTSWTHYLSNSRNRVFVLKIICSYCHYPILFGTYLLAIRLVYCHVESFITCYAFRYPGDRLAQNVLKVANTSGTLIFW